MAAGKHPFPFRTRQLSPPAPMVLGGRPPGRVGRRRDFALTRPTADRGGPRCIFGDPTHVPPVPTSHLAHLAPRPPRTSHLACWRGRRLCVDVFCDHWRHVWSDVSTDLSCAH